VHKSVLIIDDDAGIADALSLLLGQDGYEVKVASDGQMALKLLEARPRPHMILLDLSMPGMDGHAFLKQREQNASLARIPTFVMSAGDMDFALTDLHVSGWLRKPIKVEALQQLLRKQRLLSSPAIAV
jgi:putative two-component system response regulator